ncbi:MAG: NAD(P)H-dependent oxidoreductase [Oscillospiraceae bacterium]|jgi:chromate reductase|nr:NAD(P)H-dependent oxidoreductase [Oscillospiraceae bacterium]
MDTKTIGILVGSLREGAFSGAVARHVAGLLPPTHQPLFLSIGDLPLYNEDLDEGEPPAAWTAFREALRGVDALLFVTPEYNRSLPAALKNALDVGSRPYTSNGWSGKPGAVISLSPGAIGGFGANHHLRQIAACVNIPMMAQPEAYLGHINKSIDADGQVIDPRTQGVLKRFVDAFLVWVGRF